MIIYISSNIYSYINIENKYFFESSKNIKEIKLKCNTSFFLTANPVNNSSYKQTVAKIIINNTTLQCDNKNILIIKHNATTYELIVLFEKNNENLLIYENLIEKNTKITIFSNEIIIQKEKSLIKHKLDFIFSGFDFIEKQKYLYFIFYTNIDAHLVVYDISLSIFNSHSCDKIKREENSLILATKNRDYIKSLSICIISLPDYIISSKTQKKYEIDKLSTNESIIPFCFIQAIKIKDFALSRKYLSEEFNNILQDSHLENFFGNFIKAVKPKLELPPHSITLVYKDSNILQTKHYTFKFKNKKIIEIIQN